MEITKRTRREVLVQHGVFVVLLIALIALAAYLAHEYRGQRDITQNARNTLSQPTRDLLAKIAGPVHVTTFAAPQDPRGDLRKQVTGFFEPYTHLKPDLTVSFVDPREDPKRAQEAGIRVGGESIIEYQQRSEHLLDYSEQAFANTLLRLMRTSERWVMNLDGHGERSLSGIANHDLGEFGKQLQARGFKTNSLNLAVAQEVPANVSVLIIADPQVDLQPSEVEKIKAYLQKGGNLLWLIDPEPLHGLQPIAEMLNLTLGPGTVVDPDAARINASPAMAIGANYSNHPITDNFRLNTLFPFARQIGMNDSDQWHVTRLIDVAPRGWVEMDKLDNKITFDKARDIPGPINVAGALERAMKDGVQRVVVIGSGNFLANQYLGNAGNLDLGLNVVNWLAGDDAFIAIQPRPTIDSSLDMTRGLQYLLLFGFLFGLPLVFISTGTFIWWRRHRG